MSCACPTKPCACQKRGALCACACSVQEPLNPRGREGFLMQRTASCNVCDPPGPRNYKFKPGYGRAHQIAGRYSDDGDLAPMRKR